MKFSFSSFLFISLNIIIHQNIIFFTVPDRVSSMSFGPPTSRSVNVSWNPPCRPNGLVKSYRITIKNNNISEESMLDTNQSIPFHCVKNLLPYVDYSFSVSTEVFNVNDLGAPYSSPDVIRTSSEGKYICYHIRNIIQIDIYRDR